MIIMQLRGGLGNQMFQYALGRRLALERKVPLKLDLRWFQNHPERIYRLEHFKIQASVASENEITNLIQNGKRDLFPRLGHFFQSKLPYYRRNIVAERLPRFDPRVLKSPISAYLSGYWQSPNYFEPIETTVRQEFELATPMMDPEVLRLMDRMRVGNSVSLHVRRGDYLKDEATASYHGVCSISYYQNSISYLRKYLEDIHVYVFSDDIEWAKNNLHLGSFAEFISGRLPLPDYLEMELMRQCNHHIIANSSFSWWAAWLCKNNSKIVIAPKMWFTGIDLEGIVPSQWLRL